MKPTTAILSLCLLGASLSISSARTWTDSESGRTIDAELVGMGEDGVKLQRSDGTTVTVPLDRLSAADKTFLETAQVKAPAAAGGDWPGWRGPNRDNRSPDTGLLKEWPKGGPKLLWTFDDGGTGYSCASLVGGKLYFTGTRGGKAEIICLDAANGKELWSSAIGPDKGKGYNTGWGGGPRGAVTIDDGLAYAMNANGYLVCVSADDGSKKWSKELVGDLGGGEPGWGYSESPLVDGDKLIVTPGGDKGAIAALDKKTGKLIWQSKDVTDGAQYASVTVAEVNGKRQYIQLFMKKLVGVSADDGKLLWSADWAPGRTAVIPTPVYHDGMVYMTAGYGSGCQLVKIDGPEAKVLWENKVMKNHHGGVILDDGHIYGFSDGGGLTCQELKSGDRVWSEKGEGIEKGAVHYADGMLYCVDEKEGSVFLAEATSDGFKEKGRFPMPKKTKLRDDNNGKVWAHPVVIGGRMYLRDQDLLFCFDVKE
jgi:outer membrane protein assembly factor BamB